MGDIRMASRLSLEKLTKILVYVLFASAILPVIASQMATLEGDTTNFSATEILLLGLVTLFVILGLVYAVVKTVL
jgi:uncharacterized protein YqhQ